MLVYLTVKSATATLRQKLEINLSVSLHWAKSPMPIELRVPTKPVLILGRLLSSSCNVIVDLDVMFVLVCFFVS